MFPDFFDRLLSWFHVQKRSLPWRENPEIYAVWISEIMLQQTQIKTVLPYFNRFIKRFPDVKILSEADEEEVFSYWAGLGYYTRAANLLKAAKIIVQKKGFPIDRKGWESLPGVGSYTAGAVCSIALNQCEAILDGNVERVFARIRMIHNAAPRFKKRLWNLSRFLIQKACYFHFPPSGINQALMELGALVCTPQNPICETCPLSFVCKSKKNAKTKFFPGKNTKQWEKTEEILFCMIDASNSVLLEKKTEKEWRKGLYDLPAGIPKELSEEKLEFRKEITTRHIVTNHKILRKTQVYFYQDNFEKKENRLYYLLFNKGKMLYPIGRACVKTLEEVKNQSADIFFGN
ncbi:MAG TPA: A/G-specific adenine glycosylase [Spirochaetia bacterium]|nr:A/G-specific adenine glycosylase [Spirochaetia bacterium]